MIIDDALLDEVTARAAGSPRLRMNHNFHESPDSKAQRLLNVLLPGTVLPVHRHRHTAETYALLRGRMTVIFYDGGRNEIQRFMLDPAAGNYGVHIRAGQWHGIEVIEPSTILEVKDGPYMPLSADDILE